MTTLLLAGALFAYAYPADAFAYRVTLDGEGYASSLLGEGRLEGSLELRYAILRRPSGSEAGEARFEPANVDLRWNGGRMPIKPETLAWLFKNRAISFRAEGLAPSTEAAAPLPALLGPLAVASALPPLALCPSRIPNDARFGSSWPEDDASAPFGRTSVLTAIEPDFLTLAQTLEPKPGSRPAYAGSGTVRLDRVRGATISMRFDLRVHPDPSDKTKAFSIRVNVEERRPTPVRPAGRKAEGPLEAARGWFDEAVRWGNERWADARGYWTMLEAGFRMSLGGITDPEPLLRTLKRRLGLGGG
ncbi:MAG: hypothetical protein KIS66_15980 [Fimbriimonadaceae bacterium]|nr:hypothetical protein [Fimbriimonadaceae bacterium]